MAFAALHYTTLHYTPLHYTALHYTTSINNEHPHCSSLAYSLLFLHYTTCVFVFVCAGKEKRDIRLAQIRMHAMVQVVLAHITPHTRLNIFSQHAPLSTPILKPHQHPSNAFLNTLSPPPPSHCCPLLSLCGTFSTRSPRKRPDDRCDSATLSRYVDRNPPPS